MLYRAKRFDVIISNSSKPKKSSTRRPRHALDDPLEANNTSERT